MRLTKEEFCNEDVKYVRICFFSTSTGSIFWRPLIEKWTGEEIEDIEAEFDAIDTNGGGMILFQEVTNWAFSKNFDLEDDIDSQADEEEEEADE